MSDGCVRICIATTVVLLLLGLLLLALRRGECDGYSCGERVGTGVRERQARGGVERQSQGEHNTNGVQDAMARASE